MAIFSNYFDFTRSIFIKLILFGALCVFVFLVAYHNFNRHSRNGADKNLPHHNYKSDFNNILNNPINKNNNNNYTIVNTNNGKVRGVRKTEFGVTVSEFLGIPYAMPPVGNLRFEKPTKLNQWKDTRDAIDWPQVCPQNNDSRFSPLIEKEGKLLEYMSKTKTWSEDCLYLNIWSPQVVNTNNNLLPVLVVIPGGGFSYFGISFDGFDGGVLASLGNVVVVTVQYRLGFLGFFQYEDDSDKVVGNMGLADQIMALEWIRDNIKFFGGNPEQVTLSGESAGGTSIALLMTSPQSNYLFQRAILQSGNSHMYSKNMLKSHETAYPKFVNHTACADVKQKIQCLKKLDAKELLKVETKMESMVFAAIPAVPHELFPQLPRQAFSFDEADEEIYQKEVLIGINKNEASLFLYLLMPHLFRADTDNAKVTMADIRQFITNDPRTKGKISADIDQNMALFASFIGVSVNSTEDIAEKIAHFLTDIVFACPSLSLADQLQQWNDTKVYLYYLTSPASYAHWPKWMSVPHIEDIHFQFGIPLRYPQLYDERDISISKRIMKTWAYFAETGEMLPQLDTEWPLYTENNTKHMELNKDYARIGNKLNENFCSIYEVLAGLF